MNTKKESFETHCLKCGELTNISEAKAVNELITKIKTNNDVTNSLIERIHKTNSEQQVLHRTIKQLLNLIPKERIKDAMLIIHQPKPSRKMVK